MSFVAVEDDAMSVTSDVESDASAFDDEGVSTWNQDDWLDSSSEEEAALPTIKFFDLLPLRDMAAINVAIQLWYRPEVFELMEYYFRRVKIEMRYECYDFWPNIIRELVMRLVPKLNLPKPLAQLISPFVEMVSVALLEWIAIADCYMFRGLGERNKGCLAYRYYDCIHWNSDGSVDELRTAEILLKNPTISDIQKFRIMATHCMADRLLKITPKEFRSRYFEPIHFCEHPLQYYWSGYFEHEHFTNRHFHELLKDLETVYSFHVYASGTEWSELFFFHDHTPEDIQDYQPTTPYNFFRIFVKIPTVSAAKYFWERVSDMDAVQHVECNHPYKVVWYSLSRFSAYHLYAILQNGGSDIVSEFFKDLRFREKALRVAVLLEWDEYADVVDSMFRSKSSEAKIEFVTKLLHFSSRRQIRYLFSVCPYWLYPFLVNNCWSEHLEKLIFLFTNNVKYEWRKRAVFSIDWNNIRVMFTSMLYANEYKEFIERVLLPEDAAIIKEKCWFLKE